MAHTETHKSLESFTSSPATGQRKPLVLVIDPDESTRSVLEVALSREGFDVWSASSGAGAMTLLQGRSPEVIVLESDLGSEDGFSFVAQLRGDDRLGKLPVLLLARPEDQNVEAMADVVGVDDFIQKPAFARDVAAMVRVELARRAGGPLRFDSKILPPAQLLRALMSCPRSGRLLLVGGRAEVRFRSGKVIDARFEGRGGSVETLVRALALTTGSYELKLEPVDGFAELRCGLREVVELVMPRLQQWVRVQQRSLPLDARLAVDFARLAQSLKAMPDEVNRVVRLFDGFRTVEQVLVDSELNETLTLEVATRLYLMGVLGPVRGEEDSLLEPRPMPRLFEPRATEAEELMQRLFAGTAEIRAAESAEGAEQDWLNTVSVGSELDVADPNGGWTTAPVPERLAADLAPELARQLDAFQTPMRVEAAQPAPEAAAARKFAHSEPVLTADTAMEAALMRATDGRPVAEVEAELNARLASEEELALEAQRSQARGRQARIETPWMTPVVEAPTPAPTAAAESTVHVDDWSPAAQAEGAQQLPVSAPMASAQPKVRAVEEAEAAFFADASPEVAEPVQPRAERRIWPYLLAAVAILAAALLIESRRTEQALPLPAPAPVPVVVAPVLPDIEPPEFIEVEAAEEPAPVIDVTENLAEASRLYTAGQYRRAISVLEQVLADDPKSVAAWNLMALARYDSLDSAGARAAADKVLELDPENGRVQILLATLYFDANQKELGRAALEKYLALEPNGQHVEEARALLRRY